MAKQDILEYTLDNGLKVFLIKDPSASLVSVRTYVHAGSVDEDKHLGGGLSHYLEHLVAGGSTSKRGEDEYKKMISHLGGAYNAYTTSDHTSYFINTVPEDVDQAVSILYEWMFFCKFDQKEFDRERDVIIKEIEKNDANIGREFYQMCQDNFYKYHPMRLPVIGYLENFRKVTVPDLIAYYGERYVPSNMILVIGGNLDEKKVMAHVKETFGSMPNLAPPKSMAFREPAPFAPRMYEKEGLTNVTYVSLRWSTIDIFSSDLYSLDLLEFILGNGEDSLLHKTLVEDKKLAYSIRSSSYTPTLTTGYFEIALELDYKNKQAAIDAVNEIIEKVKRGQFTPKRIERARKQKLSEDIFSVATIEDKVSRVGQGYIFGHTKDFFERYVQKFKTVSKQDVVQAAKHYLDNERVVVTVVRPKQTKAEAKSEAQATVAPAFKTPTLKTLSNGVRVLFYKDDSLPRVYSKIFVLGGMRAETVSKNGVGQLLTELLGQGSELYSKQAIKEMIEDNGAQMAASLGKNTLYYNLDCLSDDFPKLLPLFFHTFLKPKFPQSELDEVKRKTINWIGQRQDDWYRYGSYLFKKEFYKTHPYGLSNIGEKDTVEALDLKDVDRHFQKMLQPKHLVISIFGNFDEGKALKEIEKQFSHLKPVKNDYDPFAKIDQPTHNAKYQWQAPIPQDVSAIFIGYDSIGFNETEENLKLDLVDSVLSGLNYPGGRLHNILRDKGFVYMVHGTNQPGMENGMFLIYALTSPDKVAQVKEIILNQIHDIQETPISDEEFLQAMAQLNFYYRDRTASLDSISVISATDELYGRGHDFYTKMDPFIAKLTKRDVQDAARKYLKHPQILIIQKK